MRGRGIGSARGRATIQRAASEPNSSGTTTLTLTDVLSQIAEAEETEEGVGVDSPVVEVKKSQNRFFLAVRSFWQYVVLVHKRKTKLQNSWPLLPVVRFIAMSHTSGLFFVLSQSVTMMRAS